MKIEEKLGKYDQLELLQSNRESILSDKVKIREPLSMINIIGNWVFALERLKNGRWTRFGASENELIRITLLQAKMCDRALNLYKDLIKAIGTTKDVKSMNKEIEQLTVLSIELNEDLSTFIKLYGTQAFTQNWKEKE